MSIPIVYGSYCELVAAGIISPFLFKMYYNNNLYNKFDEDAFPVTGNISGSFYFYLSISNNLNFT